MPGPARHSHSGPGTLRPLGRLVTCDTDAVAADDRRPGEVGEPVFAQVDRGPRSADSEPVSKRPETVK